MSTITVPIDGKQTKLTLQYVQLESLFLDEHNPRIGLYKDNQPSDNSLSEEEIKFALANKSPEAYGKLRTSIHTNRGIINPIWLEEIGKSEYRVIEGNTRVLIYKELTNDEPNENQWKKIISYILPKGIKEDEKNFIRLQAHLRGTHEWDAYEKAKYLYKLSVDDNWPISKIEKQTKLRHSEIIQNIEAYKIMQQQYLPSHPDPYEVAKFSYFVEYVKDKKLKKAMDKNGYGVKEFCEWVGDKTKIPTGQDVRKLRDILEDTEASEFFKHSGYEAAIEILSYRKPDLTNPFYRDIERVIDKLKVLNLFELDAIANEEAGGKKRMISELVKWSSKILVMIEKK